MLINQTGDLAMMKYRAEFMKGVASGVLDQWSLKDYIASRQTDLFLKQQQQELDDIADAADQAASSTEGDEQ